MTNLFSIFDPSTSLMNLKMNWMTSFVMIIMLPSTLWMMNNRYKMMWKTMLLKLNNEFKMISPKNKGGMTLLFMVLLIMIMTSNLAGLFPHLFTSTSHLSMTMTLALPLWLSFMMYGWIMNSKHMFTHLVPMGTPSVLMPFMVCIETISNIIRPGTLAVRLSANMIAGHLIMTLLGNTAMEVNINIMPIMLIIQMMLLTLETAVAIIQSYVFTVLTILYSNEVN
uniref:ATP synthase F0 subunit 6 n=1 Tax=Carausius morosus TaxID=7022 RepID=UPI0030023D07|nr:ATP synthase F0 subunit 6 [Carausius morosus]